MEITTDIAKITPHILELEQAGMVTRTFRRLDPERQHAVLLAILEEAQEKGPLSINIKEVAKRAGVSVGSLYTYFNNRDGLVEFTIELCSRWMKDSLAEYTPFLAAMPLREGLKAYIAGGVEWSQLQDGLTQFFLKAAYGGDEELGEKLARPIGETLVNNICQMLLAAIERGEVRENIDLEGTARIIHGLTIALGDSQIMPVLNNYFQAYTEDLPVDQVLETALDVLLKGIAPKEGQLT